MANLTAIEDLFNCLEVLPYGAKAAPHCGAIRAALEKQGQPVGVNDAHIAGHARCECLIQVANNLADFGRDPLLNVEDWIHCSP